MTKYVTKSEPVEYFDIVKPNAFRKHILARHLRASTPEMCVRLSYTCGAAIFKKIVKERIFYYKFLF